MYKKILSVVLAVMMILSVCTVAVISADTSLPEKQDGKNRYYFYLPDEWINEYSDTAGIYWWEGTDFCSSWPGYTANKADADGVYYYDVPQDVTMIIWNNALHGGTDSTQDIYKSVCQTVNIGTEYYDPGESDNYPDGTDNFDDMIYVIDLDATQVNEYSGINTYAGEWYYYYGGGEYGFTPEKGDEVFTGKTHTIKTTEDVTPTLPATDDEAATQDETTAPTEPEMFKVYFTNTMNWSEVYIYHWIDDVNNTWPGEQMTYIHEDEYGRDVYTAQVPADSQIIFNAGMSSDIQTVDLIACDGTGYYIENENEQGKWNVCTYVYEEPKPETTPDETTSDETTDVPQDTTENTPTPVETYRYYFYMPDEWKNEYTDTAGIYWWNGSDACSSWPGYTANKTEVDGVYYYDVPRDVPFVIWNNALDGGADNTQDICTAAYQTVGVGTEYYDAGESDNYPEGTDNFDDMIYVIDPTATRVSENSGKKEFAGEWYYYYGNGEYGFTPEKGEEFFTGKTHVINGEDITAETYRYYFYMPDEWKNEYTDTAGIYWWEGTDFCSSWPGYTANKTEVDGVYYYDVPKDVTVIIWNNNIDGGSDVTQDIYKASAQTINIGTEYYDPGESDNYPNGTDNFDGMIYVIDPTLDTTSAIQAKQTDEGEWYYYYGNGEYGFTPEKGEEFFTGKTHVINEETTPDTVILTDEKTLVSVEGIIDAQLTVNDVTTVDEIGDINFVLVGEKVGMVYDITLVRDGAEVQPDAVVTVRIPAVDESSRVYRLEKDGTLTNMGAVYEDGFLVFTTEHFSIYVVTEELGFDVGDANMDGYINIKDATEIQKHTAKLIQMSDDAQYLADFDKDGNVNIKDATAIQKFVAGIVE